MFSTNPEDFFEEEPLDSQPDEKDSISPEEPLIPTPPTTYFKDAGLFLMTPELVLNHSPKKDDVNTTIKASVDEAEMSETSDLTVPSEPARPDEFVIESTIESTVNVEPAESSIPDDVEDEIPATYVYPFDVPEIQKTPRYYPNYQQNWLDSPYQQGTPLPQPSFESAPDSTPQQIGSPLFADVLYYPDEETTPPSPGFGRRVVTVLKEVLETVVPAVILALLINIFIVQTTLVFGQSMEPNFHTNQRLLVEKVTYHLHTPNRGDVIVLKVRADAEDLLIKRVIALPGETVEVREGHVYIDNQLLDEPYLSQPTRGHYGPTLIPENHVFVLGDNRGASNDSRSFGSVDMDNIFGRAWVSIWPLEEVGLVD